MFWEYRSLENDNMTHQMSLREQADFTADLDGIADDEGRKAVFNRFRTIRDNGAIAPDLPTDSGRAGAYSMVAVCGARLVYTTYETARRADVSVLLGRWLAERPLDPSADAPVGKTYQPPSRIESIVRRVQAGEAVTLTVEHRRLIQPGLSWGFILSEPPAESELAEAARMVRDEKRRASHEVRASIVLPVSDLIRPVLDKLGGE